MTFLSINITQHRRWTITGLVAETLTVKTHTIGTHVTKTTRTITLTTGWNLGIMCDKDLIFPKPEEAGDQFRDSDTIMVEANVDIRCQRMFTMAVRCETFDDSQVGKFKRSIVYSKKR